MRGGKEVDEEKFGCCAGYVDDEGYRERLVEVGGREDEVNGDDE